MFGLAVNADLASTPERLQEALDDDAAVDGDGPVATAEATAEAAEETQ